MTFDDIMTRASSSTPIVGKDISQPRFVDWMNSKEPLVQLRGGEGTPIYLIPGSSGTPDVFTDIAEQLSTPVYGVHIIPESPDTLPGLAEYLFTQIKQIQPHGPYRIGGFCVGTTVTLLLAEKFLKAGDQLNQVALIEGFPLLFASPALEMDQETVQHRRMSGPLEQRILDFLIDMYATEPISPSGFDYRRIAEQTTKAIRGEAVSPFMAYRLRNIRRSAQAHAHFTSGFADPSQAFDPCIIQQKMVEWLSSLKQPMTFYVGDVGIRVCFPNRSQEWDYLGVGLCDTNIRIKVLGAGHFSILGDSNLISALDNDW